MDSPASLDTVATGASTLPVEVILHKHLSMGHNVYFHHVNFVCLCLQKTLPTLWPLAFSGKQPCGLACLLFWALIQKRVISSFALFAWRYQACFYGHSVPFYFSLKLLLLELWVTNCVPTQVRPSFFSKAAKSAKLMKEKKATRKRKGDLFNVATLGRGINKKV